MKAGYPLCCLLLLLSCSTQEICEDGDHSELVVRFKTVVADVVKDTILTGVSIQGVREGLPDSLIYDSGTLSRAVLPMDVNHEFTRFVLRTDNQSDTLRINHATEFYLISYTCGFAPLFTITSLQSSTGFIHDMEIINAVIDAELEQNEEHIWLYF